MHRCAWSILLLSIAASAQAEIYECVDQNGNKRFTNIAAEAKGCKVLNVGPVNSAPAAPPASPQAKPQAVRPRSAPIPTPANFPRVDRETQQARDNDRRRILEQELGTEQKLLDQARRELSEQEATRLGSERNYQRVLDRLAPYQEKVRRHEDNVANIRRELSKVR